MRIVVDVNHPADVHLFKNFIWDMEKKGHDVLITATEKDVTFALLDSYGFSYINLGSYGKSLVHKLVNIPILDFKMYRAVRSFKPDILLGFGSFRAAHASFLLRKTCIVFDDTESSMEQIKLYLPFVDAVCTPSCFSKNLGKKQIRFDGYKEIAYLHPNYFKPNPQVLDEFGLHKKDTFTILRFVSWDASHDINQHGIQNKIEFVKELDKYGRVLITSEADIGPDFEKYKIKVSPEKLHDLLYYATLYIGEGATTAAECAVLGTPSIYISSLSDKLGYIKELEEKYNLINSFNNENKVIKRASKLFKDVNLKNKWQERTESLLNDKIDVTKYMIELVLSYELK